MVESKHISVPRPFQSGDITEWLLRFDICSKANGWNAAKKALKLPTLLEGEALAAWTELTEEQQADYEGGVYFRDRTGPDRRTGSFYLASRDPPIMLA